jgi:hypothetical protein
MLSPPSSDGNPGKLPDLPLLSISHANRLDPGLGSTLFLNSILVRNYADVKKIVDSPQATAL